MKWGLSGVAVIAVTTVLAACGAQASTEPGATLQSWREAACPIIRSNETIPAPPDADSDPDQIFSADSDRRFLEQMRATVTSLRAIPTPDDHRDDVESFLEIVAAAADRYEDALPEIEAASRRLEQVMKSIDEDELPPAPEGMTVAGAIMSQMMSVPRVRAAFEEMTRAYSELASGIDEAEETRLTKVLGLDRCAPAEGDEQQLTAEELTRCGSRGEPVSVAALVDVLRAHGISLEIDEQTCTVPPEKRVAGFDSDATNEGPTGSDRSDEIRRVEGHVLCAVEDFGVDHELKVNKYGGEAETTFRVHNVDCALYPDSPSVEAEQVTRMRKAMKALGESVPVP